MGRITAIVESVNEPDMNKVFEALARIIGRREGVEIKVINVRKRKPGDPPGMFVEKKGG